MTIAPVPAVPEKGSPVYERQMGSERRFGTGPRYFEEGVASDTDVPNDFGRGSSADVAGLSPTQSRQSHQTFVKDAADTMRERAHVGAASWVEAPSVLSEFSEGAFSGSAMPEFTLIRNPGTHMNRPNAATVSD